MAQTPEERAFKKIGDVFADERLNVVQLGYLSAMGFTPSMIESHIPRIAMSAIVARVERFTTQFS